MLLRSCLGIGLAYAWALAYGQMALAPNEPAPPLEGYWHPSLEPHTVDWSASKITLVNFWADWCEPCKELMPRLEELYLRRSADGLAVLGVHSPGIHPDKITAFLSPLNLSYPILRQSKKVGTLWGVGLLPTSYLVDRSGRIVRRYSGAQRELQDALIHDAELLLDGKPLGTIDLPLPEAQAAAPQAP